MSPLLYHDIPSYRLKDVELHTPEEQSLIVLPQLHTDVSLERIIKRFCIVRAGSMTGAKTAVPNRPYMIGGTNERGGRSTTGGMLRRHRAV